MPTSLAEGQRRGELVAQTHWVASEARRLETLSHARQAQGWKKFIRDIARPANMRPTPVSTTSSYTFEEQLNNYMYRVMELEVLGQLRGVRCLCRRNKVKYNYRKPGIQQSKEREVCKETLQ